MKRATIVILCALIGCVGCVDAPAPSDTTTDEQELCVEDPFTCPGGHPVTHLQTTALEGKATATYNGRSVSATPKYSYCNLTGTHCHAAWGDGNTWSMITECNFDSFGITCNTEWCDLDHGVEMGCYNLTPPPAPPPA